jgi:hypothetical protein
MLTKEEKLNLLNDIINHPEFSSDTYKKLLTYLVNSTINDEKVKEYSIAMEVFEKSADFNPAEDSSVRVYVSNLRKKLENYYRKPGKKSKYQIHIPTGQYEVEFLKTPGFINKRRLPSYIHRFAYPGLILIIIYLLYSDNNNSTNVNPPANFDLSQTLWNDIAFSLLPVKIVIGDDIFFIEDPRELDMSLENPYSIQSIVRKHFINSEQEFANYKENNNNSSERIIKDITSYKFLPFHSVSPLPAISRLFKSGNDFILKYSSGIHAQDLLNNNIIFLGSFRNLYSLDQAVLDEKISYEIKFTNSFLQIRTADSIKVFTVSGEPDIIHTDYCLVRKVPGPNNNHILLFITFHEAAIDAATGYLTNPNSLAELKLQFEEKLGYMPRYFNIVFKSSGFERTAYKTTIEYLDEIDPASIAIW